MRRKVLMIAAAVAAAAFAMWWVWRQKQSEYVLFQRLPAENALLLYLDFARLRAAPALTPLVRSRVEPDPDYASFVRQAGFDYQRDLDQAAVCYLPDRVYILARGRFDGAKLRQYALAQGGACSGETIEKPCRMASSRPDRQISFLLLEPGLLAIATALEPDAVLQLGSKPPVTSEPLVEAAQSLNGGPAIAWATSAPGSLDRPTLPLNLSLLARALAKSQRAYLFLNDRSPNLEIAVHAVCASESQADELRRLLQGLNDFLGGLLRSGQSEWEAVLRSGRTSQEKNNVRISWTLDAELLKKLGTSEAESRP